MLHVYLLLQLVGVTPKSALIQELGKQIIPFLIILRCEVISAAVRMYVQGVH